MKVTELISTGQAIIKFQPYSFPRLRVRKNTWLFYPLIYGRFYIFLYLP